MNNLLEVDWTSVPAPDDDGAAVHLAGMVIPSLRLPSTDGSLVDLSTVHGLTVIYAYPMTGRPDTPLPEGWDMIPGARGCTPQSCAFRDHFAELRALGVDRLFGLSTQLTTYQAEAASRLHLPFPLLSDANLTLATAIGLPMFEAAGSQLLKRMTLIVRDGQIVQVFYPVFPPDRNVLDVINWLTAELR